MYLSCETKKFHDTESTHILHNFGRPPMGGSFPLSPWRRHCPQPLTMSSHPVSFTSFTFLVFLFSFLSRAHFMFFRFPFFHCLPHFPCSLLFCYFFFHSVLPFPPFFSCFPIPLSPGFSHSIFSSYILPLPFVFLFVFLEWKEWGICWQFLPARRYASAGTITIWPCVCVCLSVSLSVCLFVTSQHSIETDGWLEIELFLTHRLLLTYPAHAVF